MAALAIQNLSIAGLAPTFAAASAGGDTFVNNPPTILRVKNGGAAAITVTVDSVRLCNHGFDHDASVSIPAGAERDLGPFDQERFGGTASVAYSAVTSVTVAVIKV